MSDETPELSAERQERRAEIKRLTKRSADLYAALQTNAEERSNLIVLELNDGAVAREIAEIADLSVGRIYKLRDQVKKREED